MNQQIKNKLNFTKVEPRPSNDNILAQFLGGIGGIGQGVGEAIGQAGTGIAGGIGQGVELIGQGIGEMNKTPEGRLALRELVGAALRGVGQEDLGVGVQQFAQRVYKPEAQQALFETKQKAEAEKAERDREQDLEDYRLKKEIDLDVKAQSDEPRQKNTAKNIISSNERLINTIDDLLDDSDLGTATGKSGFATGFIPGSKAYDIRSDIKTLTANQAFQTLQAMRDASKTGGALGQVSERELDLLEKTVASLDPNQSDKQFKKNLIKFRDVLGKTSAKYSKEVLNEPYEYKKYKLKKDGSKSDFKFGWRFAN
jgi:hypothetical protein